MLAIIIKKSHYVVKNHMASANFTFTAFFNFFKCNLFYLLLFTNCIRNSKQLSFIKPKTPTMYRFNNVIEIK